MENNNRKELKNKEVWYKRWYVVYTFIFLALCFAIFLPFFISGKSFVWDTGGLNTGDGFVQHFTSAVYFGNYFRDIILNLLKSHELVIPMWDLSIGTGYDVLTSLNYYAFGDPLSIFYIFTPEKFMGYTFSFVIFLRLYLSGLFFSFFCFNFKMKKTPVIIGALCYVFCGFSLYCSIRHPFFINPMIYLPLLLLGIEKVFKGGKPYLFIIMVTISAISNFYFLYMLTIAVIIYAFIRVMYIYKEKGVFLKKLRYYFFKFLFYYIIGILLSAVIFLPVIISFFNSSRQSGQANNLTLVYNLSYYINVIKNMFAANDIGLWAFLGFNIISIICGGIIYKDKSKKGKYLKFILSICIISLLVPFFGYIMNGFSFVSNRWTFIFSFVISFISVYVMGELKNFKNNLKFINVFLGVILFLNISLTVLYIYLGKDIKYFLFNYIFIFMGFVFLFFIKNRKYRVKNIYMALLIIVLIQIPFSAYIKYSPFTLNYPKEFKSYDKLNSAINQKEFNYIKSIDEEELYRVDINNNRLNYGLINDINGLSSYFSVQNNNSVNYFFLTGQVGQATLSGNHGYDCHLISNELKGVKYFAGKNYNADLYKDYKVIKEYEDSKVYKNENALGLFYTYDSAINQSTFNSLNIYDREMAMLQSVYLDKDSIVSNDNVTSSSKTLLDLEDLMENAQYDKDKIEIKKDKIIVKEDDSDLCFNIDVNNSECYLVIDDFDLNLDSEISKDASLKKKIKNMLSTPAKYSYMNIKIDGSEESSFRYSIKTSDNTYYFGIEDYVLNLGYYKKGLHNIKINFDEKGEYNFSDMKVVSQPMDDYDKYVNELKEDKVENFTIKGNTVSLNVNTKENKIGVLSIPYSTGWKAYVNGKEVEILQANIDSMGIELNKGENEVVFTYCTPGLKLGAIVSLVTAFLCMIYIFINKKKRNI